MSLTELLPSVQALSRQARRWTRAAESRTRRSLSRVVAAWANGNRAAR